ncbi:MAG: hypothetical protein A2487_14820 [Candidatus Raymondbacteria bacterium RifOxyC12_full_50_8]|uniref:Secretion system C-terminal sorting domain-containing protein n=1 Tax=Candidatus Raymondbacteria bacterium RIFOXYD12_FULL_49_13 TaxID=1817890 RepID=A0A1F7FHX8_UNCRA|nr:MAG: hypothetical protein A2248_21350 [Candidatus Raymondbacteria bacterium RIFOXYA2_FULL_49_16]OGJ97431.1 MAG: hypothetical protein A2487_14820 [Candidatus Raymondbacteria bacterium RifOxyC12_full_50_8]OGJ98654.1 MAG: hypothetical protein A2350_14000 [Candidatus Raymondbacteria bacterium RifOxyB12_full_50_8]OGK06334.1 MAG: hypothetical protein A2519_08670 [Candidatus Raymondbacteria bacterium RIFOXYD12_FULL_49_13]OGP40668.1 MAG: hypothetical protein A2324_03420 [Candidatus Raymondbacteria b
MNASKKPGTSACRVQIPAWWLVTIFSLGMAVPALIFAQQDSAKVLFPWNLTYQGAFRPKAGPVTSDNTSFRYGGDAFAYYPNGDPSGPNDEYPGSLYGGGFGEDDYVSEITIPAPVISPAKTMADLPESAPLQTFVNPFTSLPGYAKMGVTGLTYLPAQGQQTSPKLYANICDGYKSMSNAVTMAWMDLDLSNPNIAGFWRAGSSIEWNIGSYMFEIPASWADIYAPGRILASGRMRNWGGMGPNLFACAPWKEGNPPASGDTLDSVTTLMEYGTAEEQEDRSFSICSWYTAGAWLTFGSRSAIVMAATNNYSLDWSYFSGPFGTGIYPSLLFYDPADVADVVQGQKQPYEPKWYARKNLDKYYIGLKVPPTNSGNLNIEEGRYENAGMAYDRQRGVLYVAQRGHFGTSSYPIVHVFRIDTTVTASMEKTGLRKTDAFYLSASPNPFNPRVTISLFPHAPGFTPLEEGMVLDIYSLQGMRVTSLSALSGNPYAFNWHAAACPSGIYIARIRIGKAILSKAITLLK